MAEPVVTLAVRVTPRADRNALAGVRADGTLLVRTSAAPSDGAANKAVIELLAKALGVRKSDVQLVAGSDRARKTIYHRGADRRRLERENYGA